MVIWRESCISSAGEGVALVFVACVLSLFHPYVVYLQLQKLSFRKYVDAVVYSDSSDPSENFFIIIDWIFSFIFTIEIIITVMASRMRTRPSPDFTSLPQNLTSSHSRCYCSQCNGCSQSWSKPDRSKPGLHSHV